MKKLKLILIALVLVSFNGCFFFSSTPKPMAEYCNFPEDFINRTNKISQALKKSKSDLDSYYSYKYKALLDPKVVLNSYNAINYTNCNERLEIYNAALKEMETKNKKSMEANLDKYLKENNIKKAIDDEEDLWEIINANIQKKAKENVRKDIRYETSEELENTNTRKKELSRY